MEEALTEYLLADPGIDGSVAGRLYWDERPQGSALPAIVLHRISGVPEYADDGAANLVESRIQADCLGESKAAALALARAIKWALSAETFQRRGVEFSSIHVDNEQSGFGLSTARERVHRTSVDFLLWHSD